MDEQASAQKGEGMALSAAGTAGSKARRWEEGSWDSLGSLLTGAVGS